MYEEVNSTKQSLMPAIPFCKTKQSHWNAAIRIEEQFSLSNLLQNTVFVEDSNTLKFQFAFFKTFGHPGNFEHVVKYTIDLCEQIVEAHGNFIINVDLSSITPTSVERFRDICLLFQYECLRRNSNFSEHLISFNVTGLSSAGQALSKMLMSFVDVECRSKVNVIKTAERK